MATTSSTTTVRWATIDAHIDADVRNLVDNFGMDEDLAYWVQGDPACWPKGFVPAGGLRTRSKYQAKADAAGDRKSAKAKQVAKVAKATAVEAPQARKEALEAIRVPTCVAATPKQIAYLRSLVAQVYPGQDMEAHTAKVIALGKVRVSQAIDTLLAKKAAAQPRF